MHELKKNHRNELKKVKDSQRTNLERLKKQYRSQNSAGSVPQVQVFLFVILSFVIGFILSRMF